MKSVNDKKFFVGVKIISLLIGLNSLLAFIVAVMRLLMQDRFPKNEPGLILAGFMVIIAVYFAWLAIGLWKFRNGARIATLITLALIFALLTANLIQHNIFPNFKNWCHYYIYPILFVYLLVPPVRRMFNFEKDLKTNA